MEHILQKLKELNVGTVIKNEPLKKHTTMKIGGPADIFIEPNSIEQLRTLMAHIKKSDIKWRAIGRGSNLLVHDNGIRGIVIKLGHNIDHLNVNGTEVLAGGGYSLVKLATLISKQGLSGLEFAGGIPGTVGGAVYMNAGAHGSDISHILKRAHIIFEDGTLEWLNAEEMEFSYRTSILQNNRPGVCVEALFELKHGDRDLIVAEMKKNKDYRRETQPWNFPCAGSIFRNPLPNYAGQLIERAGLKGHQIGGAQISELHGNFIVNTGNATAKDVFDLINFVKETINQKFQIKMETEVEIIGDYDH